VPGPALNVTRDIRDAARLVRRAIALGACAPTKVVRVIGERREAV
jgi:hypothetical protein